MRSWHPDVRMFHSGQVLKLGELIVACTTWASGTKEDPASSGHGIAFYLPGLTPRKRVYSNEADAMKFAEQVVDLWLKKTGLKEIEHGD